MHKTGRSLPGGSTETCQSTAIGRAGYGPGRRTGHQSPNAARSTATFSGDVRPGGMVEAGTVIAAWSKHRS